MLNAQGWAMARQQRAELCHLGLGSGALKLKLKNPIQGGT